MVKAVVRQADRAIFGIVFLMLFAFSYSEQLVSGVFETDAGQDRWRVLVIIVDAVVLGVVGALKRVVTKTDGDAPRLWRWWWAGVATLIGVDLLRLVAVGSLPVDVLTATIYAAALGLTIAASLNADPLTLFNSRRRIAAPTDWARVRAIVPLVAGAWLCYLAASAYVDLFDVDTDRTVNPRLEPALETLPAAEQMSVLSQLCEGAINAAFFEQVVAVIPVLLLAIGVEYNYFRRTLADAGQRAATAATATVLAAGLVGALSTLPWDGHGCGDVLSRWHEYIAFLLAVQGVFTGLATLIWLLVSSTPDGFDEQDSMAASEH